jgi:hypothetical protein
MLGWLDMALVECSALQAFDSGFGVMGVTSEAETLNQSLQLARIASGIRGRGFASYSHKMQPMWWV